MTPKDLFDLTGKLALVTGGARGLGGIAAEGLVAAGARGLTASGQAGSCGALARGAAGRDGPGGGGATWEPWESSRTRCRSASTRWRFR